ncbi:MAG TPA: hypothetical protein VMC81_03340 [Rhodocyclaceae bacterium]|nr:hypothetical protein [Rhodocyclaceae bacterium]
MAIDPTVRARFLEQLTPANAAAYPKHLEEAYPHVLEKISSLWGSTAEMDRFFNELLTTQRTDRQGFSADAFGEILGLMDVYRKLGLTIEPPKQNGDVWSWVSDVGSFADIRGGN